VGPEHAQKTDPVEKQKGISQNWQFSHGSWDINLSSRPAQPPTAGSFLASHSDGAAQFGDTSEA